ncbi:putative sulfate/molybdate transporter [Shewanella acanthi]|uniref:putative sulfate/molybdate transporter n=1 Tax=Shewanella acanthi TaxID=2864212 RepID=UPI001C65FEA7|nr:putative sulfate/molybdate transporter [Shewanella acanthi]QYJ78500.1 putative sulfate/molybdate transporter [Shewanella acanthi]
MNSGKTSNNSLSQPINRILGETSGAFADLGTFLPLVLGLIALNQFSPQGIFLGFGLFAILSALFYRRPIPVQPMKVIAAIVIAQGLTPGMLQASAMLMGIILLVLAFSGAIAWLARQLSQAVSVGIQLAIGLQLMWMGAKMMGEFWPLGLSAFAVLFFSKFLPLRYLAMPLVIAAGMIWQATTGEHAGVASFEIQAISAPLHFSWPTTEEWSAAALLLVLPQLALTLTNAVIATSVMAREKFPEDNAKLTPKNFAITSGLANLLLSPFGATAMCHGAGGLAVQYHFGARTYIAPLIFGSGCLLLSLLWNNQIAWLLSLIPLAILGSLLTIGGMQLAWSKRLVDGKPFCIAVILVTAITSIAINAAAGLAAGLVLEQGRRAWAMLAMRS